MTVQVERIRTNGIFSLDGQDFDVENNVWVIGDRDEVIVIDAAHEPDPILAAIGDRTLRAIVCTHGHNDHINAASRVADTTGAPVFMHPDDQMLWHTVYPDRMPDAELASGQVIRVAGAELTVLHTPGHSPGGVSLHLAEAGAVFSGDTLFNGGPGATGRSFSDFPTIIESIRSVLLTLPADTVVHTGHGDDTTISAEAPHLDEWITRGH